MNSWRVQPPSPAIINPKDSLASGLIGCWALNEGTGTRAFDSSGNGFTGAMTGAPVWSARAGHGRVLRSDGGDDLIDIGVHKLGRLANGANAVTMSAWVYPLSYPAAAARERLLSAAITNSSAGFFIGFYGNTGLVEVGGRSKSTDSLQLTTEAYPALNEWHHILGILDYADDKIYLYIDGIQKKATTVTFANSTYTTATPTTLADRILSGAAGDYTHCISHNIMVWKRKLTDPEIRSLYENPYKVFYKNERTIASLISGAKTIVANTGSFILTGIANTLKVARLISSDTGSFTVVGNATNLLAGRKITSDTGAYVLTGNAAGLIYTPTGGYNFAVETGAFTLTGNSANLLTQRKLGVTTGAFTLTGQEASLLFGRKIAVDTGVFALSGTSTALTAARKILAETGAYTFTGNAATLTSGATATYSKNAPLLIDSIGGKVLWIGLPKMSVWNTNGRPSAPTTGVVGFNSQTSAIEVWNGSSWKSVTLS